MENQKDITQSELRSAYQTSWNQLTEYLQTDATKSDYEKIVAKSVGPILKAVGDSINHEVFNIGRGLIHLNSRFMNRRLSLPFVGSAYSLTLWHEEFFKDDALSSGVQDKQLMFLQPDRPLHLLTELMWRFQGKHQWGKGHALAIFPSDNSTLLDIVKSIETIIPLVLTNGYEGDYRVYLKDLPNKAWEKEKLNLCKKLNQIRKEREGDASVSLGREYDLDDIERLMRRPLNILSGKIGP